MIFASYTSSTRNRSACCKTLLIFYRYPRIKLDEINFMIRRFKQIFSKEFHSNEKDVKSMYRTYYG